MESPTLLLLPGLGADGRFFSPQQSLSIRKESVEWIEPESQQESLAHYAGRLGEQIGHRAGAYVAGASLGAMVALELANQIGAAGVFLIGGCRSHREISPLFRAVLSAGAMMPRQWIGRALMLGPPALKLLERLDRPARSLMMRMLNDHSRTQLQWSCRAILEWECCRNGPKMPVWAIHGNCDEVIPPRYVEADEWVRGGHHLISLAHPDVVNRFISDRLLLR